MDSPGDVLSSVQVRMTPTTRVEYLDNIIYCRLLEGAEFTLDAIIEQFKAQAELVKDDEYAVLVDATKHVTISKESREYMSNYRNPKRRATALLTRYNLAMRIMANFYMSIHKPSIPTRMFIDEEEAVKWLKKYLNR